MASIETMYYQLLEELWSEDLTPQRAEVILPQLDTYYRALCASGRNPRLKP